MAMTPLTGMPDRTQDQSAFTANCNDFFTTKLPLFVTEANALQADVDAKRVLAESAATTATTQAGTASTQAGIAATQAGLALGYKNDAAASAASAVLSPGSQATSTSSIAVGTGTKNLTLAQTGKNFVVGQFVAISRTSNPANTWLAGAITAFNDGTGDMTLAVVNSYGSGTYTDWTIAQAAPVAPNTVAIGALRFSQDVGTVISPIGSDPATYLRTGTVATAATYPAGALVDYIKAYGAGNVSLGAFVGDIATDGNQTIVCTYDNANVLVSTNGGSSWSTVASNIASSGIARSVCWTGSRFVVAGGASACQFAYSTNGTSWTTGATVAGSANSGYIRIRWDGTNCMAVSSSGSSPSITINAIRTADGSSAVIANTITTFGVGHVRDISVIPGLGANRWLLTCESGLAYRSTAADGSSWSASQTLPFSTSHSIVAVGSKFVIAGGSNFYYSSTGLTGSWTQFTAPTISNFVGSINVLSKNALHWDGTRLWVGGNLGTSASIYSNACVYTTDTANFATWSELQLTYPLSGQATYGAGIGPVVCGNHLLFIPLDGFASGSGQGHSGTVSASYQLNWASGSSYVGHSLPVTLNADGTNPLTRVKGYVRVA